MEMPEAINWTRVLGIAVTAIVVVLLLAEFNMSIAPLSVRPASRASPLASPQGVARDFLRGFSLLLDKRIRVGDAVEIAGRSGAVEEVTLRHLQLSEHDGSVRSARTGQIDTVTNRSRGRACAVLEVALDASVDTDRAHGDDSLPFIRRGRCDRSGRCA